MLNKMLDGKLKTFQEKIKRFISEEIGSNKAEMQKWLSNGTLKESNLSIKRVLYVRTILSSRDELNLLDFYYPSTFVSNSSRLSIDGLFENISRQPSLIIGTVGQGKSIALRYISFYILCKKESIPIFLELRKLRSSTSLFEHLRQALSKVNLICSEKLLKSLLSKGRLTLCLDGFDEIKYEKRSHWVNEIESFYISFTKTKIFVTTRPDTELHHRHLFINNELSQLEESDKPKFIRKLIKKEDDQIALITKLKNATDEVNELLKTPLLMALFISVYRDRRKLPNSNSEFFDELFSTILSRHDGLKAAYDRPSKCGFTDKELKLALQSLAYQTRKNKLRQLPVSKLYEISKFSLNAVDLDSSKSELFIQDVNNITCILQKDGLEYRFIHDSVQEFYSASFVRDQEEAKKGFYGKYIDDWHDWNSELNFLRYIDKVSYTKYLLVPSIKAMCSIDNNQVINGINKDVVIEILKNTDVATIVLSKDKNKSKLKLVDFSSRDFLSNWASDLFCKSVYLDNEGSFQKHIRKVLSIHFKLNGFLDIKDSYSNQVVEEYTIYIFNLYELLFKNKLIEAFYTSIDHESLYELNKSYTDSLSFLEKKSKVEGIF